MSLLRPLCGALIMTPFVQPTVKLRYPPPPLVPSRKPTIGTGSPASRCQFLGDGISGLICLLGGGGDDVENIPLIARKYH